MIKTSLHLSGIELIQLKKHNDKRGLFVKNFQKSAYSNLSINIDWKEEFYSISKKNVFRGLHFQEPPFEQWKLVTCLHGEILDYIVDIRKNSSTYGSFIEVNLNGNKPECLLIPPGFAHGFYTKQENTLVSYKVSKEYNPSKDKGISWKSLEKDFSQAIISERDEGFPTLNNYNSPF